MLHDILFLLIGLLLIFLGGNYLTDGAEFVARRFHISELVIGMTVVAFGSSTPDFVISFMSTLEGKSQLALGDVVGANIFDLLLVVGIMAMITPIPFNKGMRTQDMPMLVLSALALFVCGDDVLFDGTPDLISRTDGILLIAFFAIFMYFTFHQSGETPDVKPQLRPQSAAAPKHNAATTQRQPAAGPGPQAVSAAPTAPTKGKRTGIHMNIWWAIVGIVGGLAALVIGGNWIVDGASGIARKAGLSEAMIGLTVVAFGSSVPDLATSVIAAMKKQTGIALGNVVGSCVFNVFFIIGVCATCRPLNAGNISAIDFGTLMAAAVAVAIIGMCKRHTLNRTAGICLTIAYTAYMAYVIIFNSHP